MARLLRANSIVGPFPGWPAGGWGARAGVAAMPGVRPGAGPKGSVWMREPSIPIAARPALISSMNGTGPQMYASASRGGESSTSSAAVRRPALSKSRPSRSSGPGRLKQTWVRTFGSEARSARASAAKEWSRLLRAPWSHQISRTACSVASAWSMARTGVAPMPALISSTGALVLSRMKVPRGAAISSSAPTRRRVCR